jgi:hypothetical protein
MTDTTKKEQDQLDTDETWTKTTEAGKIWEEIKSKPLAMFSLPSQKVSDYCQPAKIDKNRCFLVHRAAAVIPSLEAAIGTDYSIETADKYIIVSRVKNAF